MYMIFMYAFCHDHDRTYPYTPYPDLSTPIPSYLNHSRAPNAKPEPSDPLASQQHTPEHSDSLAFSQRIPDPMHLQPFLSLTSSRFLTPTLIPDLMLIQPFLFLASSRFPTTTLIPNPTPFNLHSFASSLFPMFHWSCDCGRAKLDHIPPSLDVSQSVFPPSLYICSSTFLCHITCYPPLVFYVSPSVPHLRLPLFHLSLFLTSVTPTLVIPYIPYDPFPIVSDHPDHYHTPHLCKYTKYKML